MNEELKNNIENSEMAMKTKIKKQSENKIKKVKFEKDENSYEQQFDCILEMIQQAVEDLNVWNPKLCFCDWILVTSWRPFTVK